MRVPKITWIVLLVGIGLVTVIVRNGPLSRSKPTDRVYDVSNARRSELAEATKAIGTIAAVQPDRPDPPETGKDAGPTPDTAPAPPPSDVAAPVAHRSKSGEATWDVRSPPKGDGGAGEGSLCGGKVCRADQFCCGPPECGHCASRMTGPRCPTSCP